MKLTHNSQLLISFFIKKNLHINSNLKNIGVTQNIIFKLYNDILKSYKFLNNLKKIYPNTFYTLNISKINNINQIPKPKNFNSNSFPKEVIKHIDSSSMFEIIYKFTLFNRDIKLIFIVEDKNIEKKISAFDRYVDNIVMWLYILNEYASTKCSKKIIVYFYFTLLTKNLPNSNVDILDQNNINTAFTTTCPIDSEIVIFRKEEWFKVFLHESFHNFALDFSDMNNDYCHELILNLFPVQSEVNLYEAYTEFWAEIINALFCSFYSIKDKNNFIDFVAYSNTYINLERSYSLFQLVKVLEFMGLTYKDLYSKTNKSKLLRNNLYKENTNVLSYYVIKSILLYNYQSFLVWCNNNNLSLLQFKKTINNQKLLCEFIYDNYKTKKYLNDLLTFEDYYFELNKNKNSKNSKNIIYLLNNLRMSICELG
jgi:hypothetical protein